MFNWFSPGLFEHISVQFAILRSNCYNFESFYPIHSIFGELMDHPNKIIFLYGKFVYLVAMVTKCAILGQKLVKNH